jgi:hypothetical protein
MTRAGFTDRERRVLRFAGEQYAVSMGVVEILVDPAGELAAGGAARQARRTVERLERLGYAGRLPLRGERWMTPTAAGLRAVGLDHRPARIRQGQLDHLRAVALLRLHLAATEPTARWEPERDIRARLVETRARRVDGGLWWPDGEAIGVEVELTLKRPERYLDIVLDRDRAWSSVWWFTPPADVDRLTRRLADARGGSVHQVYPLPDGIGGAG